MAMPPSVWTGPPVPPPPAPAPPPKSSGFARSQALAALLALALVALLIFLGPKDDPPSMEWAPLECGAFCDRSREDIFYLHLDPIEYRHYIELHVTPTLVAISVSVTGAACQALGSDAASSQAAAEDMLDPLREAREVARAALKRVVEPPPDLQSFHDRYERVLASTVRTVDAVEECAGGAPGSCNKASEEVLGLTTEAAGFVQEVRNLAL